MTPGVGAFPSSHNRARRHVNFTEARGDVAAQSRIDDPAGEREE